jgi:carboxymethylenebutenolidase
MPDVSIPLVNRTLDAYLAVPEGEGPWPGVLVLQDKAYVGSDGSGYADRLARKSYVALVPYRDGIKRSPTGGQANVKFMQEIELVCKWLTARRECGGQLGIIGFGVGADWTLRVTNSGNFETAALNCPRVPRNVSKFLVGSCSIAAGFNQDQDGSIAAAHRLGKALISLDIPHDIVLYTPSKSNPTNITRSSVDVTIREDQRLGAETVDPFWDHALRQLDTNLRQPFDLSITAAARAGYDKILLLRIARAVWLTRSPSKRSTVWAILSCLLPGSWPLFLELIVRLLLPSLALQSLGAMGWVAALSLYCTIALLISWKAWKNLEDGSHGVDLMLRSSSSRRDIGTWLFSTFSIRRQLIASAAGTALAFSILASQAHFLEVHIEINWISYVTVSWVGAVTGAVSYWVCIALLLAKKLLQPRDLHLVWHSPASTPGLWWLSDGYMFGAWALLLVFIGAEFLTLKVPGRQSGEFWRTFTDVVPIVGGALVLMMGLLPHWWLYSKVKQGRREVLAQLLPYTDVDWDKNIPEALSRESYVELYRLVETSPNLPFSTTAMVQYIAAVVGSVIAYFLSRS